MGKNISNACFSWRVTMVVFALALFPPLHPSLSASPQLSGKLFAETLNSGETEVWPMLDWSVTTPSQMGMDAAKLAKVQNYALKGGGSGYIIRAGRLVWSWGSPTTKYELKSTTKSIGVTGLGLAVLDGRLNLDDLAGQHYWNFGRTNKKNHGTGWLDPITIRHLATHSAGLEKDSGRPEIIFAPGTAWSYSDGGANWLADLLTLTYQ